MAEEYILFWIFGAFAVSYIIHRLFSMNWKVKSGYEKEIEEILNKEEYKVKGRFD